MLLDLFSCSSVFSFEDRSFVPKKVNNIESGTRSDSADSRTQSYFGFVLSMFLQICWWLYRDGIAVGAMTASGRGW